MNPEKRGLGYKHDDALCLPAYGKEGAPLAPLTLREPDQGAYVLRVRDQGGTSSCVGQALAAAIEIHRAIRGEPCHVSARWLYTISRELERPSFRGRLTDDGTFPAIACEAARLRGLVKESVFPFVSSAIDERPGPAVAVEAFDARGLEWATIDSVGSERIEALEDALRRGFGVLFAINVSDAYQRNDHDGPITEMGPSIGGHMQTIVASRNSGVRVLNSWGRDWRENGYVTFDRAFFAEMPIRSLIVVREVPNV